LPTFHLLEKQTFNFGTVSEGQIVEHAFKFKNDGAYPLILSHTSSSCGCTTPQWPKDPIKSGATSEIIVRFDSKGKSGPQLKTITVFANTNPEFYELRLQGAVNSSKPIESY
jgi:hypothetical protein